MIGSDVIVAGVDGCPAGWLVVLRSLSNPATATVQILPTFSAVLAVDPAPTLIAIDIPIGLPDRARLGGRLADIEARKVLGPRAAAVFAVPARAAVMQADYRAACAQNLANSNPPRMVSKQMFHLFPKIREVDAALTPALQERVKEVHPEVAFSALNGWQPLVDPKKSKSSPNQPGLDYRRALLTAAGYPPSILNLKFKRREASTDDVLDACANSWTAARIITGTARRFPATPERDAKSLYCEIWG